MKQLLFMVVLTATGTVGVYVVSPFLGVFVYYLFAVLRPQYMWKWSLPEDVSWSYYVAVATIGAVVLGLRAPARQGGPAPPPFLLTAAHRLILCFAAWVVLTAFTAYSFDTSYEYMKEYLKIFTMFGVSVVLVRALGQIWALYLMSAVALGYIGYEVNYLYFVNGYLGIYRNGYGGLDNNGAGLTLAMGVPLCWFAYEGVRHRCRWLFLFLIPVLVHAVLMTYSRGAMLSLIVASPWVLLRSGRRKQLGLIFLVMGVVGVPLMAGKEIRDRFVTIEHNEVDESANQRRAAWGAAWRMALDHPVTGVGLRNANLFSRQYGADREGRTIHSQYLQILADNGFVGLGLYVALYGATFLNLWRVRRLTRGREGSEARRARALASGVECALVLFSVGSAFLSLEVVELPYLLVLLAAQLAGISGPPADATVGADADEPLPLGASAARAPAA